MVSISSPASTSSSSRWTSDDRRRTRCPRWRVFCVRVRAALDICPRLPFLPAPLPDPDPPCPVRVSGPLGPFAPGKARMRAEILESRRAGLVAEASRVRAVSVLRAERAASPRYLSRAAAIFPVNRPTLNGGPWVGDVGALVAAERHDAQFSLAAGTVCSQALFVRRAMHWMRTQWRLQLVRRPFSAGVVADHPDLLLAYLRHLSVTSKVKQLHKHVKDVRSAINGYMRRCSLPPVANLPAMQALSRRLKKSHSPAFKKTKNFTPADTISIVRQWGFGFRFDGTPAFTVNPRGTDVRLWRDTPYRSWVALAVRLGLETLSRFDDLSFITAASVKFARDGDIRVLSVCFTHKKQNQSNVPVWVHVPDSGSPYCAYRLLVHILTDQCGLAPGIDDPVWVFPPAVSEGGLGSGAGFLFPRLTYAGPHSRFQYDPAMDWSARALTTQYSNQMQNAVSEVFNLERGLAAAYGSRSMRCGGDTALHAAGISGNDRRDIGFWTSETNEREYLRINALGRARSLLQRGITFL